MELLRRLYKLLGGDPSTLDSAPVAAMGTIYSMYDQNGLPAMTSAEVTDALSTIATLHEYLNAPPASINPSNFSKLSDIEAALNAMQ